MSAQLPIPSFDDIRKILNFWFDQKDKWFYFETGMVQIGVNGEIQKSNIDTSSYVLQSDYTREAFQYSQSRIVGKIHDVIEYPPSLLLQEVTIFTAIIQSGNRKGIVIEAEKRKQYELVFSQLSYYEPIDNIAVFISNDSRVNKKGNRK